jgi:hypothetical protein
LGLREEINKRPGITSGVMGAVVLLILVFVVRQFMGNRPPTSHPSIKFFYTADDGHTWFVDDFDKVTPFDHDGATAVRCFVFKCGNSAQFAGYLQSYTQALHDQMTGLTKVDAQHPVLTPSGDTLVKKPGQKEWIPSYSPQGTEITNVHCPDGSADKPEPVYP